MDSIIDKTAIMNVIKQYTGVDDGDEARNKLLSRGLFSKARESAEETRGQVASAVSNTVEDALASVAGLTNLTISKRSVAEDLETPDLDYYDEQDIDTQEDTIQNIESRTLFSPSTADLYEARVEKPTDAKVIDTSSSSTDAKGLSGGKVTDLLNFIGKGEGGYESAHSGTIGGKIQNSTSETTRDGKKLTELTVGEIKEYMDLSIEDKDRLFAVGKFQFIPDTFNLVVEKMNLSDDKVFTSDLQEEMGTYLLTDKVGRKLQTWLYQDDNTIKKSNVNDAMLALAKEFASVPVPFDISKNPNPTANNPWPKVDLKAGDSYYKENISGGNSAQHTVEETKDMLMKVQGSLKMIGQVSESPRPRRKPAGVMERPPL